MKNDAFVKYIRNRFFIKIVLLYSIILIGTISILIFIIITNISGILEKHAIDYNTQVIKLVENYFDRQCVNFKSNLQSLYIPSRSITGNSTYAKDIISLFHGDSGLSSTDYIDKYNSVYDYLSSAIMPSDNTIKDIFLMNNSFSLDMRLSRNSASKDINSRYSAVEKFIKNNKNASINNKKIRIIPAFIPNGQKEYTSYSVYDYIRNNNGSDSYGYVAYTFDLDSIRQAYQQFNEYLVGSILIITPSGKVIYDSSENYYGGIFPYASHMSAYSGSISNGSSMINYDYDSNFDFVVVGILPYDVINKSVTILNRKIIITSMICLACIILLTMLISRAFSKRVQNVVGTLKEIQKGNFSAKAQMQNSEDEIQVIARNINIMSEKISEYIKREYIFELRRKDAELKQKTAQLYALQIQVNPHFLYNTLEAIRMKAMSVGDSDTSQMIKILARLFRNNLKDGMIVSIKEELKYCEYYLELINIRFGDYIHIIYDIDPAIEPYAIPKHVMQPIIENAIVHGYGVSSKGSTIIISGSMNNGDIFLSVKDSGKGIDEQELQRINSELDNPQSIKNDKIGIYNVNSRIKLIFGDKYGLKIYSKSGEGTEVVIAIKAMKKELFCNENNLKFAEKKDAP